MSFGSCAGSQHLEMLGPSGLPETMDIDRAVAPQHLETAFVLAERDFRRKSTGFAELQIVVERFKIFA